MQFTNLKQWLGLSIVDPNLVSLFSALLKNKYYRDRANYDVTVLALLNLFCFIFISSAWSGTCRFEGLTCASQRERGHLVP